MELRFYTFRSLGLLLICMLASGCVHWTRVSESDRALPLLAPASLQQSWQMVQSVKLYSSQAEPLTLLVAWSVSPTQLHVAALTPTGQSLFRASYDGQAIQEEIADVIPQPIRQQLSTRDILAQLQLAYWPVEIIEAQLRSSPWEIQFHDKKRRLLRNDRPILDIQFNGADNVYGGLTINHLTSDLRLQVDTISHTPTDSTQH